MGVGEMGSVKHLDQSSRKFGVLVAAFGLVGLVAGTPLALAQQTTTAPGKADRTDRRPAASGQRIVPNPTIEPTRGVGVEERARESYAAQGLRVGSFIVLPSLRNEVRFNDNLFATPNDKVDDFIFDLGPEIRAISNWRNHSLNATVSGNIGRYAERIAENYEDFLINLDGRLDITKDAKAFANLQANHLHEERGSVDDANGRSPTTYNRYVATTRYEHGMNKIRLKAGAGATVLRYDNTETTTGLIFSDNRDRVEYAANGRGEYMFFEKYGVFASLDGIDVNYDTVDTTGLLRSSTGYDARVGALIDFTGLLTGEIYAGYVKRRYNDSALTDIGVPIFGVGLLWNVSGLTTLEMEIAREIAETTSVGVSGILNTKAEVTVNHELKRNILLRGKLGYTDSDFRGTGRSDESYNGELGMTYLLNQNFSFEASLKYTDRTSSDSSQSYEQTIGTFTLVAKM